MGNSDQIVLAPSVGSPRRARAWIRTQIEDTESASVAALLVSELVANAVIHAHSELVVTLEKRPSAVVVEVEDHSIEGVPDRHRGDAMPVGETGRGLHLVAELSTRWGVRRTPVGKVVWFEVSV